MQIACQILMVVIEVTHGRLISDRPVANDNELCPIMFGVEELPSPLKMLNLLLPCSASQPRDQHQAGNPKMYFNFHLASASL